MGSLLSNLKKSRRGQALVEFALVFPIFMAMVLLMVDVLRYYFIEQTLTHQVRAGLRAGVAYDPSNPPKVGALNLSRRDVIKRAVQESNPFGFVVTVGFIKEKEAVPDTSVLATITPEEGGNANELVTLKMEYQNFTFLTPFMGMLFEATPTGSIPLKVSQSFKNEDS
jgi:hypothetical protein